MTMNLFDQFMTPYIMGIPLMLIALFFPMLLVFTPTRLHLSRLTTLQMWLVFTSTKHLLKHAPAQLHPWAKTLITVLLLLISLNLLGLLPYTFTPTTQLALNMGLAIPLWITTVLIGLRNRPSTSLAHLLPQGSPTPLIPALVIIETASILIRPLALGVRITANLTAGHLLIMLASHTTMMLTLLLPPTSPPAWVALLLLTGLELAVAVIQAYVFVLLLTLYLQENM